MLRTIRDPPGEYLAMRDGPAQRFHVEKDVRVELIAGFLVHPVGGGAGIGHGTPIGHDPAG